jgi:hypothetical protein
MNNKKLIWVNGDFAKKLKIESAKNNKPVLAYTRYLAMCDYSIEEAIKKQKKDHNEFFKI